MRTLPLFLLSLLGVACAEQVAHADWPHDRSHWADSDSSSTIDEVRDAKPAGQIEVHAFAGRVRVIGWTQNRLKVHASTTAGCRVDMEPSGDRVEVRLECSHGPGSGDLEIEVPQGSALDVRTMSAGITVTGVSGATRLQTVTADIDVKGGAPSELEARTTSGAIRVDAASAQTRAQTVSGDVSISGARGKASVHTVSGDCKLAGGDFSDVRVETVSGDVSFTGGVVGSFEVASHSGDVGVHVPVTTNADAELRSFSGDLVVDMGNGKRQASNHELNAKIGNGGPSLRVRTFSGNASISH